MAITYTRSSIQSLDNTGIFLDQRIPYADGCWSWFNDPRAIYKNGSTYISFVTSAGDDVIVKYNHSNKVKTTFTLHATIQQDDHANPALLFLPSGKLVAFYSAHNGANLYYRISTNPEDISAWDDEQSIANVSSCSYATPVMLSAESNRIYVFYRYMTAAPNGPRYYVTSDDLCQTWSDPVNYLALDNQRPYLKITSNNIDKIHFAWNDAHPNEIANNSLYHAFLKDGIFYHMDNTAMGSVASDAPFAPSDAEIIYDSTATGIKSWVWDIALDTQGYPGIVYATFPNATNNHRYRYAKWNGVSWDDYEIMGAGPPLYSAETYYSGGICLDHNNPAIIYLSNYVGGKREIVKLVTSDNGTNWKGTRLTQNSTNINCRPISNWNHPNELEVVWWNGTYTTYSSYNTKVCSTK